MRSDNLKKYSANYANTNHNFVIQNLDNKIVSNNKYYPAVCIVKNILQRGKPTLMSRFLQSKIGQIHKFENFKNHTVLISQEINTWERLIRGCEDTVFNPAQEFFENTLEQVLGKECKFIKNLIVPEVLISEITQECKKEFKDQQVDFYLPQAFLVIEIDGSQHKNPEQLKLDKMRDNYLTSKGIKVLRISVENIQNENFKQLEDLREYIIGHKILTLYKDSFHKGVDVCNPILKATTVMRYQILILELLKYGRLSLADKEWCFELKTNNENSKNLLQLAIQDLFIWFACILKLQRIPFYKPKINITEINSESDFSNENNVKIDFSLLKRYSDKNQTQSDVIFVRTDYIDTYRLFKKENSSNISKFITKPVDHFKIEIANLITYTLDLNNEKSDNKILKYLIWNIFLQADDSLDYETTDFREGQLAIIKNILQRQDTIGLLPTGSGKSICYQLAGILQPAPSIVVAPINSLMQDQVDELSRYYFHRATTLNSGNMADDKSLILKEFEEGKYFYIFISPERFQNKEFRAKLKKLKQISYAVIDEAHCLSEWGHDFRTSYLTLINTIRTHCCSDLNILALTATASLSVLKDLKLAIGIYSDFNVKTPLNYSRDELEFHVIDTSKKTSQVLSEKIKIYDNSKDPILIFTPYKTAKDFGCEGVCNTLKNKFPDKNIKFFHGSLSDNDKKSVQLEYKNNEYNILVATKAFGMGINKGNICYTFHYGIPNSLEALYQEAGRAGRAKTLFKDKKAQCFILFSNEYNKKALGKLWDLNTSKDELFKICTDFKLLSGDVKKQIFLMKDEFISTKATLQKIKYLYNELGKNYGTIEVNCLDKELFKDEIETKAIEKYLYKLYQLGVVSDWTVNYYTQTIETNFDKYPSIELIKENCQHQIQKYDQEFSFENIEQNINYTKYFKILNEDIEDIDKYIKILVEWGFDKFIGYRRQSLKNVYEACENYILRLNNGEDEQVVSDEFKKNIESYFTVNEATHKLVYLTEKPFEIGKCFEVFYIYNEENKRTEILKSKEGIVELKNILSRLLEEYPKNYALNLVSGITRFLLNEFENSDGKSRLENALQIIKQVKNEQTKQRILIKILKICQYSQDDVQKIELVKILFKYFDIDKYIVLVNKYLNDSYTGHILIKYINKQLSDITKNLIR